MFIDTHCHLAMMVNHEVESPLVSSDLDLISNIIEEAHAAGVTTLINVGTSLADSLNSVAIAKRFELVFAAVGIHPCDATESWLKDFDHIRELALQKKTNKIVAIGEVGLDFYHKPFFVQRQEAVLKTHIELAIECQLPIVFHVRDAGEELLKLVEPYAKELVGAVVHCFSQNKDFATTILGWGFYVGIDAHIGYPKNAELRTVVAEVPLDKLVLETDAPFLPPAQFRGKQNKPSYIPLFAQTLADIKGVKLEILREISTRNACKLFGLTM